MLGALALFGLLVGPCASAHAEELAALAAAASGGDPAALFELGDRHEQGRGVEQDFQLAAAYMRLAAQRGHTPAQYRLGLYHAAGLGVAEDPRESYAWLTLASRADGREALLAEAMLGTVASALSDTELVQAKSQVTSFTPGKGPTDLPSDRAMALAVAHHLPSSECARAALIRKGGGKLEVERFVPQAAPITELSAEAREYFRRQSIDVSVTALDEDLCPVVDLVTRHSEAPIEALPLQVRDGMGRVTNTFRDGAYVVLDFPGFDEDRYLAVDFFLQDGHVVHLFPNEAVERRWLRAGERLLLGDPTRSKKTWQVGPPFGNELIVILSSAAPIYEDGRKEVEPTDVYLRDLEPRLARSQGAVQAYYRVVRTTPK